MANTAGNLGTTWGWGLGENNWKATHDKNLRAFDALVQCHIIERVLTTPPATPADGDCYIPATGATGAWAGHVDEIARWNGVSSQWEFWVPRKGWEVFNESDNYAYRWSGTAWAGCNFSFTQLDQNYIKRSGETTTINTTGGFSTSGVTRITSGGVGNFTGLTSVGGGTITGGKFTFAPAAAGYASVNIPTRSAPVTAPVSGDVQNDGTAIILQDQLTINGATRPAWGGTYKALTLSNTATLVTAANVILLTQGLYNDGTNTRGITTGQYGTSFYFASTDGSLKYDVSSTTATAGAIIADMLTRFQVSRQGGVGFYGIAAPTARPSVTGSRGGNAALASLLTTLAACGIISDTTTA